MEELELPGGITICSRSYLRSAYQTPTPAPWPPASPRSTRWRSSRSCSILPSPCPTRGRRGGGPAEEEGAPMAGAVIINRRD